MSYKTTRDVLRRVINFHINLKDLYGKLADKAKNERSKILLEYMSKHQDEFIGMLTEYEEGASNKTLNAWFQFEPDKDKLKVCEEKEIDPSMTVDGIINLSLQLDNCLIKFYGEMAEFANDKEVREIFLGLAELVKRKELIFVRDAESIKMI